MNLDPVVFAVGLAIGFILGALVGFGLKSIEKPARDKGWTAYLEPIAEEPDHNFCRCWNCDAKQHEDVWECGRCGAWYPWRIAPVPLIPSLDFPGGVR